VPTGAAELSTGTAPSAVVREDAISVVREQSCKPEPLGLVPSAHMSEGYPHVTGAEEAAFQTNPTVAVQAYGLGHRQQVGPLQRREPRGRRLRRSRRGRRRRGRFGSLLSSARRPEEHQRSGHDPAGSHPERGIRLRDRRRLSGLHSAAIDASPYSCHSPESAYGGPSTLIVAGPRPNLNAIE
jgi:hypothetical protein